MKDTIKGLANISSAPNYSAEQITGLIDRLSINEKAFALIMNVTPATVRLWTSGAIRPSNTAVRLMELYDLHPENIDILAEKAAGPC